MVLNNINIAIFTKKLMFSTKKRKKPKETKLHKCLKNLEKNTIENHVNQERFFVNLCFEFVYCFMIIMHT